MCFGTVGVASEGDCKVNPICADCSKICDHATSTNRGWYYQSWKYIGQLTKYSPVAAADVILPTPSAGILAGAAMVGRLVIGVLVSRVRAEPKLFMTWTVLL